jgi:N-acetylneuraminic acid mutarotase
MRSRLPGSVPGLPAAAVLIVLAGASQAWARDLTYDERVQAQSAIERVYYSHLTGSAKKPFDQVMTKARLEAKVRTYLKESAALEKQWGTPVTEEMLRKEVQRIASQGRMPDRLLELYAALGNDPFLVEECLARPILVERMTHSFFAFDQSLHQEERRAAEEMQHGLAVGRIDARTPARGRNELRLALASQNSGGAAEMADVAGNPAPDPSQFDLSAADLQRWDARLPAEAGGVGPVLENRDDFVVHVLLDKEEGARHVANYVVPKTSWETWWAHSAVRFDERSVQAVASSGGSLPMPDSSGTTWSPDSLTTTASSPQSVAQAPTDDTWNNASLDGLPDARYRHSAIWTGSEMIVWGGFNNGAYLNTGGRYDPVTDTWRATSTIQAPTERAFHTAIWTGSVMFVWGGYSPRLYLKRNCSVSETIPTSLDGCTDPSVKVNNTCCSTPNDHDPALILGVPDPNFWAIDTGGLYNPATDTWQPTPMVNTNDTRVPNLSRAPSPRWGATAVFADPLIIIWGGFGVYRLDTCGLPTFNYLDDGGIFNMFELNWDRADGLIPADNFPYTTSEDLCTGGSNPGAPCVPGDPGYCLDGGTCQTQDVTHNRPPNIPKGRWQALAATFTRNVCLDPQDPFSCADYQFMALWGGFGITQYVQDACLRRVPASGKNVTLPAYVSDGAIYDITNDVWTPMTTTNAPLGRTYATSVWTGSQLVVWGGYNGGGAQPLRSGGRYDPIADTWTATTQTNAPYGRYQHSAVWTGSKMIVWGGQTSVLDAQGNPVTEAFGDGGQYDPATDTWSAISPSNAPLARFGHSAVWTGSQMIIWGGNATLTGRDYLSALNSGARYNPATDAWTPTLTTAAPAPRSEHSALWTGSEMLIWGGADHSNATFHQTGGRYNPATDSWIDTSIVGAPSGRAAHSAVLTDDGKMLVWGGYSITGFDSFFTPTEQDFSDGGRYDLVSGSWAPLSTIGRPAARRNHTAVWTGNRMVIWGGDSVTYDINNTPIRSYLGTGARYDPSSDTWSPTSLLGAPTPRTQNTAVWTGSRMLIWGGFRPSGETPLLEPTSFPAAGASYDPQADTWSPISTTNSPNPRYRHTAVWTGTTMIVWGGYGTGLQQINNEPCCFGLFTGGLYDPATDTWLPTAMSSLDKPAPNVPITTIYNPTSFAFGRLAHSAVWTGSKMIVWGGTRKAGGEFQQTGGRYDPATDTWTPTSLTDPASPRSDQTAVWTGEEMILFGGTNGSDLQSGGRYAAPSGTLATYYLDSDGDGTGSASFSVQAYSQPAGYVANTLDCNDADPDVWATPSEVRNDSFRDPHTLVWDPPSAPGATTLLYDALRSAAPNDFLTAAVCLESDGLDRSVAETTVPARGTAFFYLVRAQDGCPGTAGVGSLGTNSKGIQRSGRACP